MPFLDTPAQKTIECVDFSGFVHQDRAQRFNKYLGIFSP